MSIINPYVDLTPSPSPASAWDAQQKGERPRLSAAQRDLLAYQQKEREKAFRREQLRKREEDPTVQTEGKMLKMLAGHFDQQRNRMFVRSMAFGWEMDMAMVTGARVLHEIEVKVSASDWQNDRKKDKWTHKNRAKVGKFWYAVPGPLISKKPAWVPDTVGLIAVGTGVTVFRPAKMVSEYRVQDDELNTLYQSMYFRWWTAALRKGEI